MSKWLICALFVGLFWGSYGLVLSKARTQIGPMLPVIGITVGYVVYCTVTIILPMFVGGKVPAFNTQPIWIGFAWAVGAGLVGAAGAHFLTMSMGAGGKDFAHIVMAVVFGSAVTIAGIIGVVTTRGQVQVDPRLYLFMVGMLICTIGVAYYTPHAHAGPPKPAEGSGSSSSSDDAI